MKIRILHILYSFNTGGLENGLINLINNLPEESFHHVICILSRGKSSAAKLTGNNVSFQELEKRDGNDPTLPFRIASIIRRERVDLVHSRNWVSLVEGVTGAILAGGKPVIHSEHGKEIDDLAQTSRVRHLAKKACYRYADRVITVSRDLHREIVGRGECDPGKVVAIINGVDCRRFDQSCGGNRNEARSRYGIPQSRFVIGSVGRLAPVKNFQLLVELCGRLDPERFAFVLVGEGPERGALECLVREHGVSDRFLLTGEMREVSGILSCLDLFINTSHFEGISNTILEAMATGLPILANDVGGNRELVTHGENGFLVADNDPERFLEHIAALAGDEDLRLRVARQSRRAALERFSLEEMVRKYAEQYLGCLDRRARTGICR